MSTKIDAPADDITLPADQLPLIASTSPERIWLDVGEEAATHHTETRFRDLHEVTWSEGNASGYGVEYVRADRASTSRAGEREQLIEALKDLAHHDIYQIEYDGRVELCCHSCGYMGQHEKHEDSCSYRAARGLLTQLLGAGWDEPPPPPPDPEERIPCAICNRRVARIGMRHHMKAKHGAAKQGATP